MAEPVQEHSLNNMVVCVSNLSDAGSLGVVWGSREVWGCLGRAGGVPGRFQGVLGKYHFLFVRGEFISGLLEY